MFEAPDGFGARGMSILSLRGYSSVGRASASHAEGREFESSYLQRFAAKAFAPGGDDCKAWFYWEGAVGSADKFVASVYMPTSLDHFS